jgi:hypothetical protein
MNKPLMSKEKANKLVYSNTNRSKVDDLSCRIYWGKEIHTTNYGSGDYTYWHYMDESVEDKIKDDRQYKVWYTYRDAADPADMTEVYCVYYIEEISPLKSAMIELAEEFLRNL